MKNFTMAAAVFVTLTSAAQDVRFTISADHADCLYKCGETAVFTVAAHNADGSAATGVVTATLDNFGKIEYSRATFDLSRTNPFTVSGTMKEPGFLRLSAIPADGGKKSVYGVGFEPEKIRKASPSPEDFDEFWAEAKRKLDETTPVDAKMIHVKEKSTDKYDFYRVSFASYGGRVWGYLSIPKDASSEKKYPVRVEVPGAGKGPWTNSMRGSPDAICLKMTLHSTPLPFDMDELQEWHRSLEASLRDKFGVSGYSIAGLGKSREDFYYYRAFLGLSRAADWLASRPEADTSDFTYSGASQGGGAGLALLALNHRFTKGVLLVPALTDVMAPLIGRRSGCGPCLITDQPETDRETAKKWAPYFDGANFAARITCPVRVLVGFADDACVPSAVYATYNEMRTPDRKIVHGIGMGHGCDPKLTEELRRWQTGRK